MVSLAIGGGVERLVMNQFRLLDHEACQFDFAAYDVPADNCFREEIEAAGGRVFPIRSLAKAGFRGFYRQFRELFAAHHYDAVHAHNLHHNGLILLAARQAGVPIRISHAHQSYDEHAKGLCKCLAIAVLKRLNVCCATQLVACSDLAAAFLYGKRPYTFLPNAVDAERFLAARSSTPRQVVRESLGLGLDDKVLMCVGRFTFQKNQGFLLDVLSAQSDCRCKLVFVGSGPDLNSVRQATAERGLSDRVVFAGLRDDVPALLAVADLLVMPSVYEGLPLTAVEAQACGLPVLLSDTITRQADLGLGLLRYLPLSAGPQGWAQAVTEQLAGRPEVTDETIRETFRAKGFDVQANNRLFLGLYEGTALTAEK